MTAASRWTDVGVAPIESYDDARIAAFLAEDELTLELAARLDAAVGALRSD